MSDEVKRDKTGKFLPGQSGNPTGRTPGSGEVARLRRAIAEHVPAIVDKLVKLAKEGDTQAARLLLERVCAPLKTEAGAVYLPDLEEAPDFTAGSHAIVAAVARGELAPDLAAQLLAGLSSAARVAEIDELSRRLTELELRSEGLL